MLEDIQSQALRDFTALAALREEWAGAVVLAVGLGDGGAALPVAASVAGAVSLVVEEDAWLVRLAARSGAVDFVVNSLDEAVRAMKNEVRQRRPLAVVLQAPVAHTLREVLERGLAPQVFASSGGAEAALVEEAASRLAGLGAELVQFDEDRPGWRSAASLIDPLVEGQEWKCCNVTFSTPGELRAFDTRALALMPAEDQLRRRWLEAAPRILGRERPPRRVLWLAECEAEVLGLQF